MSTFAVIFTILYSAAFVIVTESDGLFLPKRMTPFLNARDKVISDPKKRPFCNAFTGCGRKRSNLPALTADGEEIENAINGLLELSQEPAVEDLSRQIMSEAKLWEAIQEANVELKNRQTHQQATSSGDRGAIASCALPPCYT